MAMLLSKPRLTFFPEDRGRMFPRNVENSPDSSLPSLLFHAISTMVAVFSPLKKEAGGLSEHSKHRGLTSQNRNLHSDRYDNARLRVPASYRGKGTQCQGDQATVHTAVKFTTSNQAPFPDLFYSSQ